MTAATRAAVTWRATVDDAPIAMAAAGELLAVGGAAGTAWVLEAAGGHPAGTVTLPGGILDLASCPDGGHLALTGPQGYALWHSADGRATVVASGRWSARARWAGPDRVAVADGRTAVVLDAAGRELWRTDAAPSTVTGLAWLRDGRRLAVAAYNGSAATSGTSPPRSPATAIPARTSRSRSRPTAGGSALATRTPPSTSGGHATPAS